MKMYILFGSVALVAIFSFTFLTLKEDSNPMVGTWTMQSGVYLGPDGQAVNSPRDTRQMKVINDTHFTTLWQDPETNQNLGFNGGRYTFENGLYTEYLEYFSITRRLGDTAYFRVDFKDNTLSISACDRQGEISETGYFQVWERME